MERQSGQQCQFVLLQIYTGYGRYRSIDCIPQDTYCNETHDEVGFFLCLLISGMWHCVCGPGKDISLVPAILLDLVCRRAQDLLAHEVVRSASLLYSNADSLLKMLITWSPYSMIRDFRGTHDKIMSFWLENFANQDKQTALLLRVL